MKPKANHNISTTTPCRQQWYLIFSALFTTIILFSACAAPKLPRQLPQSAQGKESRSMADRFKALRPAPVIGMQKEEASGRIMIDGLQPLSGGRVAFFAEETGPPSNRDKLRRVPDAISAINQDGTFSLRLPAGHYFLGAVSKALSLGPAPPGPGEKTYIAVDNKNDPQIIVIKAREINKLGAITVRSGLQFAAEQHSFTVAGTVVDSQGRAIEGAFLLIRTTQHSKRPNFIWGKTAKDGSFLFQLPVGRPYYLLAKDREGSGKPAPGQRVGAYTGTTGNLLPKPVPVTGNEGETISGLKIILNELPDPEALKKKSRGR